MNRTLGFFLGSAVVFAGLVLILGQPVTLAPPADRDRLPGADKSVTTALISQPEAEAEDAPLLQSAGPPVPEPSSTPAGQQAPSADVASPSAPEAEPEAAPEPVGIEQQNENELVEAWLAAKVTPPADEIVAGSASAAGQASAIVGGDAAPTAAEVTEIGWFPLWDPFHSELSANAFARRLERVTGLDYRVIKTAPAEYRVTVGYTSEDQRLANLTLIEEATGLTLSGGRL